MRCCLQAANRGAWARTKRHFFFAENRSGKFNSKHCADCDRQKFFFRQERIHHGGLNDVQFIADIPPSCGPLSGIAASLVKIHTAHLLALAIDMPFMTENYLHSICDAIGPSRGVIAKIDNRAEPLAAVYPREAEIDFRIALAGTDFSLQNVVHHLVTTGKLLEISVTKQERRLFRNVNNASDVDATIAGG